MSALESEIDDINTATEHREETENSPSSFGHIPENLNESSAHAEGSTTEPNIIQEVDSDEKKKPWRRTGVDITDYFNYGFDEKSWNAYCKKQSKMCALRRKLHANMMAQRGHTTYGEEESQSSREGYDTIGSGCREELYRCLSDGRTNLQMDSQMPHWEDSMTAFLSGYNRDSVCAFIPPQSFQISPTTLDSGGSKHFDGPSTSQQHFPLGNMAMSAGVMNAAKAWEHIIWQDICTKDIGQTREHGHGQHSKRRQYKKSDYFLCSREEEQKRDRETIEQENKHGSFEKVSGEERQKDKCEGQHEASRSKRSSSKRSSRDGDRKDRGEEQKKHRDTTEQEHKQVNEEERQREKREGQYEASKRSRSNRSSRVDDHKDRSRRRKRKKTKRTRKDKDS